MDKSVYRLYIDIFKNNIKADWTVTYMIDYVWVVAEEDNYGFRSYFYILQEIK